MKSIRFAVSFLVLVLVAACAQSSITNRTPARAQGGSINYVTRADLARAIGDGHTNLYDALQTVMPGMLSSMRGDVVVFVGRTQLQGGVQQLATIDAQSIKSVRRYGVGVVPVDYGVKGPLLVVELR